jgi:hypothetical protein
LKGLGLEMAQATNDEMGPATVLDVMAGSVDDAEMQLKCFEWICERLDDEEACEDSEEEVGNVAKACVRACNAHPEDARIQAYSARVLLKVWGVSGHANVGALLQQSGVAEAMSCAKQKHESIELQVMAGSMIIFCSVVHSTGEDLVRMSHDTIRTTVQAMTLPLEDWKSAGGIEGFQAWGIEVILSILTVCPVANSAQLVLACERSGVLGVVLDAMRHRNPPPDKATLLFGTCILSHMALNGSQYTQQIL